LFIWSIRSVSCIWLNEMNQIDQRNQMNQTDQALDFSLTIL